MELVFEASKLVLFARKQTKRSAKIGVMKNRIVSYSSRKEEEALINKKRPSSNHKWEGRASGKKGARRSFILPPQPASRLEKRNENMKQS